MSGTVSSKRLFQSSVASMAGRIFGAASQLLITGLLARTLDPHSFGLWALLYTIYTLLPNLDLGFGQALRLKLADLNARGGFAQLETQLFWGASLFLLAFGLMVGIVAGLVVQNLSQIENALKLPLLYFCVASGLTIALNLGTHVFYAYELGFERGILDIAQSIFLFVSVWYVSSYKQLDAALYAFYGVAVVLNIVAVVWFVRLRKWKFHLPQGIILQQTVKEIGKSSLWFWLLAVFASGIFGTLPLFVAGSITLAQVGNFTLIQRLFSLLLTLYYAFLSPLQSAYTRAAALGNWTWAKDMWQRSSILTLVGVSALSCLIFFLHQPLIFLWTGKTILEPYLVLLFSAWALVWSWVNVHSMVLNGLGILQSQVLWLFLGFILHVFFSLFLISSIGVLGAPIATTTALLPLAISNFFEVRSVFIKGKK